MKHLIETTDSSSLATVRYDRIVLDSSTNDVIVKGGGVNANGHPYVDLGLPSGIKWATMNVGAETETDYGYYFQWGDIVDKSNSVCNWSTYKYCNGSYDTLTKYNNNKGYGENPDNITALENEDDAATQIMGGDWRMPTKDEFDELLNNTTKEWIQVNGVNGYKFTASNGNSIFIPASGSRSESSFRNQGSFGFVWTSSLQTIVSHTVWGLAFSSGNIRMGNDSRCIGYVVRGVCE